MNEFTYLAETYRDDAPTPDLLALATRLAATPCGPLYSKHISPDRELAALLRSITRQRVDPANYRHADRGRTVRSLHLPTRIDIRAERVQGRPGWEVHGQPPDARADPAGSVRRGRLAYRDDRGG
jgi:hypothetical protein